MRRVPLLLFLLLLWIPVSAAAHSTEKLDPFKAIGIDGRPGLEVPTGPQFLDESGVAVTLASYMDGKHPVILAPVYFTCPNICGVTLENLVDAVGAMPYRAGDDFQVVALSIDPRETPADAAEARRKALERLGGNGNGIHFLTGSEAQIHRVTDALGFRYEWDPDLQQFAHAAGLAVLTPDARLARWLYGVSFQPSDLRLALTEASDGNVGTLADKMLLLCYQYDPTTGHYNGLVWGLLRAGGAATLIGLGLFAGVSFVRDRQHPDDGNASG